MVYYGGQPETYIREDPWRRGKYQVEMELEFEGYFGEVDKALEKEGFYMVDIGQWGKTYFSRRYPDLEVELDEVDEYSDILRLTMRRGNLLPDDALTSQQELTLTYCCIMKGAAAHL